ncbi:MAG TPA: terminase small subunit [Stellaceae bacterium]|nr:terminase small subunit [Stellaceae bacterium]
MVLHIALAPASEDEIDTTEAAAADEAPGNARRRLVRPVSDRVMRFVREYVRDRDGTAAAARAVFPRHNAPYWAAMTLRRPEVQAAIYDELGRRAAENGASAPRIIAEVTRLAFSDPGRIARWSPEGIELIHSVDLTDDDRVAVKRLSLRPLRGEGKRAQRFEMHDKLGALALLARITDMITREPGRPHFGILAKTPEALAAEKAQHEQNVEKLRRLIDAKAAALAEEKFKAMKAAEEARKAKEEEEAAVVAT